MKVGLYFGSFNPVHVGHLIIANTILSESGLDQLWFVVSPQNPLKAVGTLLSEYHRKYLIDIAIEGEKKLRTSNVEFSLPKPSYTIDTVTYLSEKFPGNTFCIIMGSDSYSNLKKWKNYELLLKNYRIIIYDRPGFKILEPLPPTVTQVTAPLLEISSTHIRELLKANKSIKFLVPDVVKEEIERNHYYR